MRYCTVYVRRVCVIVHIRFKRKLLPCYSVNKKYVSQENKLAYLESRKPTAVILDYSSQRLSINTAFLAAILVQNHKYLLARVVKYSHRRRRVKMSLQNRRYSSSKTFSSLTKIKI